MNATGRGDLGTTGMDFNWGHVDQIASVCEIEVVLYLIELSKVYIASCNFW
jgi:hypothetical protein